MTLTYCKHGDYIMKRTICCLVALISPTILYALDCTPFATPVARAVMALQNEEPSVQECNNAPPAEKDQCFKNAINSLANNGNYWAAVGLASDACEKGNSNDIQKWLNTAINDPRISPDYKNELTKLLKIYSSGQ